MKTKQILIIASLTVLVVIILVLVNSKRTTRFYNEFNNAFINGRLEYARTGFHASEFKVEGVDKSFVFAPYLNIELNKMLLFYKIAEKGDSIYKPAFSDTLKLVKVHKTQNPQ